MFESFGRFGVSGKNLAAMAIVLLLASTFSVLMPSARAEQNAPVQVAPGIWETAGDWVIEPGDDVVHGNKTIYVNGNLTIKGQGRLRLYNVTLVMNATASQEFHIEVMGGGSFLVYDGGDGLTPDNPADSDPSMVNSSSPSNPFLFWVRPNGTFLLNRSIVEWCGRQAPATPAYGDNYGIYSESDLTIIEDSLLTSNSVGFIANHSSAVVRRTLVQYGSDGIAGMENATLRVEGSRIESQNFVGLYLNKSTGIVSGTTFSDHGLLLPFPSIYVEENSTLLMDNITISSSFFGGAMASNSYMRVVDSNIISAGSFGLYWFSDYNLTVIAERNTFDVNTNAMWIDTLLNANLSIRGNTVSHYSRGILAYAGNAYGNISGNTFTYGTYGIQVQADVMFLNISSNNLDGNWLGGVNLSATSLALANITGNIVNNTYGSGADGIYIESNGPIDAIFEGNVVTNVSDRGLSAEVPVGSFGDIYVRATNNTIANTSTDIDGTVSGGIYLYTWSGDTHVEAHRNNVTQSGYAGILALAEHGDVMGNFSFNIVQGMGLVSLDFALNILVWATNGTAQANVMNNTIADNPILMGIGIAGTYGTWANVSGNSISFIMDYAIYVVSVIGDVHLNCSYNTMQTVYGVLHTNTTLGDGIIQLYGNQIWDTFYGIQFYFPGGNLTLRSGANVIGFGSEFRLQANVSGWLYATFEGDDISDSVNGNDVELFAGGEANITVSNSLVYNAAMDDFHLEAPSAAVEVRSSLITYGAVGLNISTTDPAGYLRLNLVDLLILHTSANAAIINAAGPSVLSFNLIVSEYNDGPIFIQLNAPSNVTFDNSWVTDNPGAGCIVNQFGGPLFLDINDTDFRDNQQGLVVISQRDLAVNISRSRFIGNSGGSALVINTMLGADLTFSVSDSIVSGNQPYGIDITSNGGITFIVEHDTIDLNGGWGLRVVAWRGGYVNITNTSISENCLIGGMCWGAVISSIFPMTERTNLMLENVSLVGNGYYGMRLSGVNMTATDIQVKGSNIGITANSVDALIESSQLDGNVQALELLSQAHFTVFNSTLDSYSKDYSADQNSSLWGINTTFDIWNGQILDMESWVKRSWFFDILVESNNLVPLPGAFVDCQDTFGSFVCNGTTGSNGYLRTILANEILLNFSTSTYYNPHLINATASGVGSASQQSWIYSYGVVYLVIDDVDGPIADAGPDQIVPEDTVVQFDGTNSTDNVKILYYAWTFIDQGIPVTLTGPTPTYIFSDPGVYNVTLTVSDGANPPASDVVQITVLDATPPIADAGIDQSVPSGTLVIFDGSGSSDNVGIVNYSWTFTYDGSPVNLFGVSPSFLFITPGEYDVTLAVMDSMSLSDTDMMKVTVSDMDPPTADAGPDQIVPEDTVVHFNGTSSTDNVGITSYKWTFMEGSNLITLEGALPTYVFSEPGFYAVTLEVMDAAGWTDTDTMNVTVLDATPPYVIYTSPYDGATEQPLNTVVMVGFSEPMDTDSVNASTSIDAGASISSYSWNAQDDTLTLILSGLVNSTTYTVTIDVGASDKAGNPLSSVFTTSFTTISAMGPDTTSPVVVYSYPEDGSIDIPTAIVMKVVFSEPMTTASVQSAVTITGITPIAYNWFSNDTLVEITIPPLSYSTVYTISISDTAQDLAGNPLIPWSASFTTESAPAGDTTPPEIIYTNPEEGETGVSVTASIVIVFSEPMDNASVESAITIDAGASIVAYTWSYNRTLVEMQTSGLLESTSYTLTVSTAAQDVAGNPMTGDFYLHFTTTSPSGDVTPPEILYTSPEDGSVDIPVQTDIVIVFSEPMNETSVEAAISISGGVNVSSYQWFSGNSSVRLLLPMLSYTNTYSVTVASTATDLAGNPMTSSFTMSFTTEAPPGQDTTRPYVILSSPMDGATGVPVTTSLIIVFSEPMNETSVEGALSIPGVTISNFVWSDNSTRVEVLLPTLNYSMTYNVNIGTDTKDLVGNPLYEYTISFTTASSTEDNTPPQVVYTYPENNQDGVPIHDDITIVFSEPMNETSVEGAISVVGATVEGYQWNPDSSIITVLLENLSYQTQYTLVLASSAKDPAENHLSQLTVTFATMGKAKAPPAAFDIGQAWWLILIIVVLVVIIILLLVRRKPAVPLPEKPALPEEAEAEQLLQELGELDEEAEDVPTF